MEQNLNTIVATAGPGDATTEEDKQATAQRLALVTQWRDRIRSAKAAHKDAFDRMKADMNLAFWGADEEWVKAGNYVVNIAQRHVQQRTAALYAKNPRAVAKPRQRLLYKVWDGDPETLKQASAVRDGMTAEGREAEIPAAVTMVLQEYEAIRAERRRLERVGETLELLAHYFMQESQPTFKAQMKAMVRRILTTGVGFVKLGFQRETGRRPEVSQRMNDVMVKIDHIKRLAQAQAKGELDSKPAELEELEVALQALKQQAEIILREGLVFDFPGSMSVIVDERCTQLRGFIGARWIAHEMYFTCEEVEEIYGKKLEQGQYTGYKAQGRHHDSSRATAQPASGDVPRGTEGMVCVYEIYDKASGLQLTLADGYEDFLAEPAAPEIQLETFWPIFALTFNECEHEKEIYPPSDVRLIRSMADEYNRARQGMREHRKANKPRYLSPKGKLEEQDKANLQAAGAHEVIEIAGMAAGEKSEDLVQHLKLSGVDPNLYETGTVFQDVQLAVGAQEANFGSTSGDTATESSIAESSRMSALGAQIDELDSFMSEVWRCAGQIMLSEMSIEQVQKIAGPGAVWPEMTKQEIADEIVMEIEAGSTGKPNQAAELRNMERVLPFIIQIPGIDPKWLAKQVLKRMDDKLDVDQALADGIASIVSMNGGQTAEAAAGMGQGPAGALNAPQVGAPGMGPTGPSATAL